MTAILEVERMSSGYGDIQVLSEVSLRVAEGEIVAVVGANGAGKSTLLRTIAGLIPNTAGSIRLAGEEIGRQPPHRVVTKKLVMIPEGGRLFPFMTVLENLELGAFNRNARSALKPALAEVFEFFPILAERRDQLAGSLSGGERQMCAIARAVMGQPRVLMLDEPSLGLSPLMVERVFEIVLRLVRAKQMTVLLVEQNVADALEMAARGYVVERGRIVKSGAGRDLLADPEVQRAYLGL